MDKFVVTRYRVTAKNNNKIHKRIRLALVSDLHDRNPQNVLKHLKTEKPDAILLAGDILERHKEGYENHTKKEFESYQETSSFWSGFCDFLKAFHRFLYKIGLPSGESRKYGREFLKNASGIAPCFYGFGNHEWYLLPIDKELVKNYHIQLLDNNDISTSVCQVPLRIGVLPTRHDQKWLEEYSKKDGIKILICHHPEYYKRFIKDSEKDTFDLIVAGHAHGGQWRFFNHGILAPGQGLFPKYHHGKYGSMIVSAGASNTNFLPRFGNPCELVTIDFYV